MKSIRKPLCISVALLMLSSNFAFARTIGTKDESVYVTINASGRVKEQIVSDWIHVSGSDKSVKDKSELKNIVNLKGSEVPEIKGNTLDWKLEQDDLFYQGNANSRLPIDVRIKYYLNNKEITPEALAGKSGKVMMKIDFVNNEYHDAKINGKTRRIYTLFTTAGMVNLPMGTFHNVKATTGEIVSDGNNQIVAFVAFPGLKESLKLDNDVIDIPQGTTITADVKNFKLGSIMIAATPKLPDMKKLDEAKTMDELTDGINQLADASKRLTDGAAKLSNGQKTFTLNFASLTSALRKLGNGARELSSNTAKLDNGVKALKEGADQVTQGTIKLSESAAKLGEGAENLGKGAADLSENTTKLVDGATKLADGAVQISSKSGELSIGLGKLVEAGEQLKAGQTSITSGAATALTGINDLKAAKQKEIDALNTMIGGFDVLKKLSDAVGLIPLAKELSAKMSEGLERQKQGLVALKGAGEKYMTGLTNLENGVAAIKAGSEKLQAGTINLQAGQKNAADGAAKLAEAGKTIPDARNQLAEGSAKLSEGAAKLQAGGASLADGAGQFVQGSKALAEGSAKVSDGLGKLSDATGRLAAGTLELYAGLNKAQEGGNKLYKGAGDILKGTMDLSANMRKFNNDGIIKLSNKVKTAVDDIEDVLAVKDELVRQSEKYSNYSGIDSSMSGSVKFIFKTDEIRAVAKK